jgi:hypothetical protein
MSYPIAELMMICLFIFPFPLPCNGIGACLYRGLSAFKAVYWAGYAHNKVPVDLASACLELAGWNLNRYRSRRIGMTGSVKKDGESFEMKMPENVRALLEPYRRKTI